MPDFCLLVVGANMGVQRMTKEHISIACALQVYIPIFLICAVVVFSKFAVVRLRSTTIQLKGIKI